MVAKTEVIKIASKARAGLEGIYGPRLRGVYLYGSAARGDMRPDSDIDIAIVLDKIKNRFAEHERISMLGSQISLDGNVLVSFLLLTESDFKTGSFAVHRTIKNEGVPA